MAATAPGAARARRCIRLAEIGAPGSSGLAWPVCRSRLYDLASAHRRTARRTVGTSFSNDIDVLLPAGMFAAGQRHHAMTCAVGSTFEAGVPFRCAHSDAARGFILARDSATGVGFSCLATASMSTSFCSDASFSPRGPGSAVQVGGSAYLLVAGLRKRVELEEAAL
jgi:hypothetical protein